MTTQPPSRLSRRLGLQDAVVIGLGSMLGTGVFVVFAPAAARAGSWLLVSLVIAATVAFANAMSTARLAALYPHSGGAYVYGRERLTPTIGALAGYAFVAGKIASAAAAALAVGAYGWPERARVVAIGAVVLATALDLSGVSRTVRVTRVLVAVLLSVLAVVVAVALLSPERQSLDLADAPDGVVGVLGAAALLFFAFAGYARIATLGGEVRDPARTIPRAVPIALAITLLVYAAVAVACLVVLGPERLAASTIPLVDVVVEAGRAGLVPFVKVAAAVAAFAVLLNLVVGIGRSVFAMAAQRDLPNALAVVDQRRSVPWRAELLVGITVLMVVSFGGLVGAVSFSAFTILVYYAIANSAALTLARTERPEPRALAIIGLLGCLTLAFSLPWQTIIGGMAVLATLLLIRRAVQ
ncbi:MAG: APC family permease [Candidatus Nanopelagicales bacterium]